MLFVDNQQTEIGETHAGLQQFVRADQNIHRAVAQALGHGAGLFRGAKARQHLDAQWPVRKAIAKGLVVLLGQQRGGHQHGDLAPVGRGDKGRAHGHFGLAEADIAADQAIHRFAAAHIGEHRVDGGGLIRRLFKGKTRGEAPVIDLGAVKRQARSRLAAGVHFEQLSGHVAGLFPRFAPRFVPLLGAQAMQRGALGIAACVAADQLQRGHRHIQLRALGVLQGEELGVHAIHGQVDQTPIAADAVFGVHDRRALAQFTEIAKDRLGIERVARAPPALGDALPEQLRLGDQHRRLGPQIDAAIDGGHGQGEVGRAGFELPPVRHRRRGRLQRFEQYLAPAGALGAQQHAAAVRPAQLAEARAEAAGQFIGKLVGRLLAGVVAGLVAGVVEKIAGRAG